MDGRIGAAGEPAGADPPHGGRTTPPLELVKLVGPAHEWAATTAFATGLVCATATLVSSGLEAGAVVAADRPIDPTVTVSGTYVLYGSISRLMPALFLAAVGHAVVRTRVLPRWTGRSAHVLAAVNLAFVPSLFFGNDPAHFYPANGWGTTALMGATLGYWLLAAGRGRLGLARRRTGRRQPARMRNR